MIRRVNHSVSRIAGRLPPPACLPAAGRSTAVDGHLLSLLAAVDRPDLPADTLVRTVAAMIPTALPSTSGASARVVIDGHEARSAPFRRTPWRWTAAIVAGARGVGVIEVHYPASNGALPEEGDARLLDLVARRLGHAVERRRLSGELDEIRRRYRGLMDLLADAVIVHADDRIVDANPAAAALVAADSPAALVGRALADFLHPAFRDRLGPAAAGPVAAKMIRLDDTVIDVEAVSAGGEGNGIVQTVLRRLPRPGEGDLSPLVESLTPRERQVMRLVVAGETTKSIAKQLVLSPKTVEVHRANVMRKMRAKTLAELIRGLGNTRLP